MIICDNCKALAWMPHDIKCTLGYEIELYDSVIHEKTCPDTLEKICPDTYVITFEECPCPQTESKLVEVFKNKIEEIYIK